METEDGGTTDIPADAERYRKVYNIEAALGQRLESNWFLRYVLHDGG